MQEWRDAALAEKEEIEELEVEFYTRADKTGIGRARKTVRSRERRAVSNYALIVDPAASALRAAAAATKHASPQFLPSYLNDSLSLVR